MKTIQKSTKLQNVCYDIRGPVMDAAKKMEDEGHAIIKLNIGNVGAFGFDAPDEIRQDMIRNLPSAAAYSDSKGATGYDITFLHPKSNDEFPIAGEGVLIELVQAPPEVIAALDT